MACSSASFAKARFFCAPLRQGRISCCRPPQICPVNWTTSILVQHAGACPAASVQSDPSAGTGCLGRRAAFSAGVHSRSDPEHRIVRLAQRRPKSPPPSRPPSRQAQKRTAQAGVIANGATATPSAVRRASGTDRRRGDGRVRRLAVDRRHPRLHRTRLLHLLRRLARRPQLGVDRRTLLRKCRARDSSR